VKKTSNTSAATSLPTTRRHKRREYCHPDLSSSLLVGCCGVYTVTPYTVTPRP
jgi:hypothetical protein